MFSVFDNVPFCDLKLSAMYFKIAIFLIMKKAHTIRKGELQCLYNYCEIAAGPSLWTYFNAFVLQFKDIQGASTKQLKHRCIQTKLMRCRLST